MSRPSDPDGGVIVLSPGTIELFAERLREWDVQQRLTAELREQRWPTATSRRRNNKLRKEDERHQTGP